VDFWAEWCGPCRALAPTFEKLAAAFGDEITFAKANVDQVPELANRYNIQAIPTLLLIKNGRVGEQLIGYHSYEDLAQVLSRHISVPAKS
jgi:thioredoxin 1